MSKLGGRFQAFLNSRWLVFVAAIWVQSVSGTVYLFGSISPLIKSSLGYSQIQLGSLGVAKNLGASVGFMAGGLSHVLPFWGLLLVGSVHTFVGYGWIWLTVTGRTGQLQLWMMWILIFVGANGDTYYSTATLVSCVQNFPQSRGHVVGILKGFFGLTGAILTQIYAVIPSHDPSSLILMIAVGPPVVVLSLMFFVRNVDGQKQSKPSDRFSFALVYIVCLFPAAYLMSVMLLQNFVNLSYNVTVLFTTLLLCLLVLPIVIPLFLSSKEYHLPQPPETEDTTRSSTPYLHAEENTTFSTITEEERPEEVSLLESVNTKRSPEDFTSIQALLKADFWLIFFCFLIGAGSGLTVIDNLGQISASLGYKDVNVFVSLNSIWNFLGRIGGGFFSEIIVRDYSFPRPVALAVALSLIAIGNFLVAMAWPGALYISAMLVGLGYGAHWAVVPATVSELFGLKNFAALYNTITVASPLGSLLCSGLIASTIYDYEAGKQSQGTSNPNEELECKGSICFFYTSTLMCGFCIIGVVLSLSLVYRTRRAYTELYRNPRS